MVSVLVLPLVIPVLIFGVSASYAALAEPDPFLPPFLILGGASLLFSVIGPVEPRSRCDGAPIERRDEPSETAGLDAANSHRRCSFRNRATRSRSASTYRRRLWRARG